MFGICRIKKNSYEFIITNFNSQIVTNFKTTDGYLDSLPVVSHWKGLKNGRPVGSADYRAKSILGHPNLDPKIWGEKALIFKLTCQTAM